MSTKHTDGLPRIDLPDVDDLAHSALQEALSFGLSHDTLARHIGGSIRATEKACRAALASAQAQPSHPKTRLIGIACGNDE